MVKLREEQKTELIKKERERRRVARLRQVRQQNSINAKAIRQDVKRKKSIAMEEIRTQLIDQVDDIIEKSDHDENEAQLPAAKRKTKAPSPKRKESRRREMTENDLILAQKRNEDAIRRLRSKKQQEVKQREERLAKKREAAQKANAIMRGSKLL